METAVLCAYWHRRPLSGLQYVSCLKTYLEGLQTLSASFKSMFVVGKSTRDTKRLDPLLSNAEELIFAALPTDWVYLSDDGKRITAGAASYSRNGFVNTLASTLDYSAPGVVVETAIGSLDSECTSSLIVRVRGAELIRHSRELIAQTVSFWDPAYAFVGTDESGTVDEVGHADEIPLGRLTYIANDKVLGAVPTGINVQQFHSGALIEIREDEEMRRLRDALRPDGLLNDPLG